MPIRRAAINKISEGLALHLGVPVGDECLEALTVAYLDAARSLYQVVSAGHGSVKIYIADGWIVTSAMELTSLPDPANRKPK